MSNGLSRKASHVNKGDPLFVIMTDKAAIEVESPRDGILAGVTAKVDDVIPVTEVIGYILAPGEALPTKAANTRSRLAALYGADASLSLAMGTPRGVVATVRLPVQLQGQPA